MARAPGVAYAGFHGQRVSKQRGKSERPFFLKWTSLSKESGSRAFQSVARSAAEVPAWRASVRLPESGLGADGCRQSPTRPPAANPASISFHRATQSYRTPKDPHLTDPESRQSMMGRRLSFSSPATQLSTTVIGTDWVASTTFETGLRIRGAE